MIGTNEYYEMLEKNRQLDISRESDALKNIKQIKIEFITIANHQMI